MITVLNCMICTSLVTYADLDHSILQIHDFHSFLTSGSKMSPDQFLEINELIMMYEDSQYTTRFTHGDLSSANILIERDKVVGIAEYWEYTTSTLTMSPEEAKWASSFRSTLKR